MTSSSPTENTGYQKFGSTLYQAFVEFPVSAATIPRQQQNLNYSAMKHAAKNNIDTPAADQEAAGESDYVLDPALVRLCQEAGTVSQQLAEKPDLAPGNVWKELYSRSERSLRSGRDIRDIGKGFLAEGELEKARQSGNWGSNEPSDLFLRVSEKYCIFIIFIFIR